MDKKTNYINDGIIIKNADGTEEIIQIPYNLNNVLINDKDVIEMLPWWRNFKGKSKFL